MGCGKHEQHQEQLTSSALEAAWIYKEKTMNETDLTRVYQSDEQRFGGGAPHVGDTDA